MPSRRRLLRQSALGGLLLTGGCLGNPLPIGQKNRKEAFLDPITKPEDNPWVSEGMFKVEPYVESYMITTMNADSVGVEMLIMPNPVDDYELTVHYTPLDEYGKGWDIKSVNYDDSLTYEDGEWISENFGVFNDLLDYTVSGHGEQIASRTIPAKSAGITSGKVSFLSAPDLYEKLIPEPNTTKPVGGTPTEDKQVYTQLKARINSLPSLDDRYRDPMDLRVEDYDLLPELAKEASIGAYFMGSGVDHQVTTYTLPPYVVEFEFDREIPKYEPFVLTFSVNDPNSVADPEAVAASTT